MGEWRNGVNSRWSVLYEISGSQTHWSFLAACTATDQYLGVDELRTVSAAVEVWLDEVA